MPTPPSGRWCSTPIRQWFVERAPRLRALLVIEDLHWSTSTTQGRRCATSPAGPNRAPLLIVDHDPRHASPTSTPTWPRCSPTSSGSPSVRRLAAARARTATRSAQLVGAAAGRGRGDQGRDRRQPAARHPHGLDARSAVAAGMAGPARRAARRRVPGRARPGGDVRVGVRRRSPGGRPRCTAAAACSSRSRRPRRPASSRRTRPGPAGSRSSTPCSAPIATTALPLRRRLELHARAAAALATPPDDDRVQSERARHACLALPLGDAREAVELVARRRSARRAGLRLRRSDHPLPAWARGDPVPRSARSRGDARPHGAHRRRAAPPR